MPLQRGEVQGYNFNRMAVEFTIRAVLDQHSGDGRSRR
jgi:hypothetical protein